MSKDVDIVIYVNNVVKDLNEESFFDETVNPLMDETIFRAKLTEFAENNLKEHGEPTLDVIQFETVIVETRKKIISQTIQSLYDKELLEVVATDKEGEPLFAPSQKAKELFGDINKKNI